MRLSLTSLAVGLAVLLMGSTTQADPYQPYAGTNLVVNFPAHPHHDAVLKVLPAFTEETGITVEVDQLEYLKMRDRQALELTKPVGDYDLIAYVVFSKADYVYADQLENLARYFMNPRLADPTYDAADLIPGYVQNIGMAGGDKGYLPGPTASLFGIPFGAETSVLAYRKDIFEKHGLKVPEHYDELVDLACRIPQLELGMGGVATRAASGQHAAHAFLLHLAPLGGRIFDATWQPTLNDANGVAAASILKSIVDCGVEGATTFGPAEAAASFAQGKSAMFLDSVSFAAGFVNPETSTIADNVGFALHPMGLQRASQTGGFGIAIPKNAQQKEAAFLLMQWLTSKHGDLLVGLAGGSPSRFSTYANADYVAKYPYAPIFAEALQYADPDWRPIIPTWGAINSDLGTTLSKVLTEGLDIQEALDGVADRARQTMSEAGYYTWND